MEMSSKKNNDYEVVLKEVGGIKSGPVPLRVAMEICARCGTCAQQCPVYQGKPEARYNPALRTDRIRKIYKRYYTPSGRVLRVFSRSGDLNQREIEEWAETFYECTGCRRCAVYCPMGIDHSVITRKGRAIVHKLGKTPKRLLDVTEISLKTGNTDGCSKEAFINTIQFLESEMKEETGIDIPIPVDKEGSDVFFVPPSGDVLVKPEAVMGIAKIFYVLGVDWTMSSFMFDGANYGLFTGDDEAMKAENLNCVKEAKRLGCKTLMMGECGHAHRIMKFMMEKANWWGKLPFETTNCMEFTADIIKEGKIKLDPSKNPEPVTYHDPCNFARSCGIIDEPRTILKASCADYREMTPSGSENWCCGGGGGLSAMDTIREFRMNVSGKKKLEQVKATGAKFVAAPCANCKRQLTQLMEHYEMDVEVGGVHDMIYRAIELNGTGKTQ